MMNQAPIYVLIHSPLVGRLTWRLVQDELQARGLEAITPQLIDQPETAAPFWQQHAQSVAQALTSVPQNRPLVLVAHSGAGPLLPIIGQTLPHPIAAYLFVDAGIPHPNASRLDLLKLQNQPWVESFEQSLQDGGQFPNWQEENLRPLIPNDDLRQQMMAEINPRSLTFFAEPIPVLATWPDSPCAYIKFSASYLWDFQQAQQAGWLVEEMDAGHFHMLVDPISVTTLVVTAGEKLTYSPISKKL